MLHLSLVHPISEPEIVNGLSAGIQMIEILYQGKKLRVFLQLKLEVIVSRLLLIRWPAVDLRPQLSFIGPIPSPKPQAQPIPDLHKGSSLRSTHFLTEDNNTLPTLLISSKKLIALNGVK